MTHPAISRILRFSGLSFSNLEYSLSDAVIESSGLPGDEATFQRVVRKVQSGIEAIEREGRLTGNVVRHERRVAILAEAVAA